MGRGNACLWEASCTHDPCMLSKYTKYERTSGGWQGDRKSLDNAFMVRVCVCIYINIGIFSYIRDFLEMSGFYTNILHDEALSVL
jgi:hypothetical protein